MTIQVVRNGVRMDDRDVWTIELPDELIEVIKTAAVLLKQATTPMVINDPRPPKDQA